jgi:hypothetical protein
LPYPCCSSLSRHATVCIQPRRRHKDATEPLHELHPQPSAFNTESFLLLEFYSGVTGPPGRFK